MRRFSFIPVVVVIAQATLPISRQAALDVFALFPWHHNYPRALYLLSPTGSRCRLSHSISFVFSETSHLHMPVYSSSHETPYSKCIDSRSHPHLYVPAPCHDNLSLFVSANSTVPSEDQVPHCCLQEGYSGQEICPGRC
ncbi:hypothetical protein BC826DRAFT_543542 [Russula brevipes]|nr:hypothetical protein BC826DRAFT_543542 [Russula brevipes]